jgi:hypothetical protein
MATAKHCKRGGSWFRVVVGGDDRPVDPASTTLLCLGAIPAAQLPARAIGKLFDSSYQRPERRRGAPGRGNPEFSGLAPPEGADP